MMIEGLDIRNIFEVFTWIQVAISWTQARRYYMELLSQRIAA